MNAFALALKTLVDTLGATVLLPVFIFKKLQDVPEKLTDNY